MTPLRFKYIWQNDEGHIVGSTVVDLRHAELDTPLVNLDTVYERFGEVSVKEIVLSTGLFDAKGVEIFEGDIIKSEASYPLEICWLSTSWGIRWKDHEGDLQEEIIFDDGGDMTITGSKLPYYEVIGNVHANPDPLPS